MLDLLNCLTLYGPAADNGKQRQEGRLAAWSVSPEPVEPKDFSIGAA